MQIDRRITNGLAWAGVVLVIGIPVADVVSAQFMAERTPSAQVAALAPKLRQSRPLWPRLRQPSLLRLPWWPRQPRAAMWSMAI